MFRQLKYVVLNNLSLLDALQIVGWFSIFFWLPQRNCQ